MEDDISEINLEHDIEQAVGGDTGALASMLKHPKTEKLIDRVSTWAAREYKLDQVEIKGVLLLKLCSRIQTIKNIRGLDLWLFSIARNYGLDEIERRTKEELCCDEIKHRASESKRHNGHSMVQSTTVPRLDRDLIINEGVRRATKSHPKWLVDRWAIGETAKEIAEGTGHPISTVYRLLRKMEQDIIKETGIRPHEKKNHN